MEDFRRQRATLADVVNRIQIRFVTLHHRCVREIKDRALHERGRKLIVLISDRAGLDEYNDAQISHELYAIADRLPFINYRETVDALESLMRKIDHEGKDYRPAPKRREVPYRHSRQPVRMRSYDIRGPQEVFLR